MYLGLFNIYKEEHQISSKGVLLKKDWSQYHICYASSVCIKSYYSIVASDGCNWTEIKLADGTNEGEIDNGQMSSQIYI